MKEDYAHRLIRQPPCYAESRGQWQLEDASSNLNSSSFGDIMHSHTLLKLALVTVVLGCGELPTATSVKSNPNASGETKNLNVIANSLAKSLSDPTLRAEALMAMRESPFVEHKLDLLTFLRSHPAVLASAANSVGLRPSDLESLVSRQGDLDFYVPFRAQRLTWTGSSNYVVGYTANVNQSMFAAVDSRGRTSMLEGHVLPSAVVLLIQPAERKDVRAILRSRGPGFVIQDANDGDLGGTITYTDLATGKKHVRPFQMCDPSSDPNCGGGSGGGPTPAVFVAAAAFYGDGVGSAEVEWFITDNSHNTTIRVEGMDPYVTVTVNATMWIGGFTYAGSNNVSVTETDAFSDDYWGAATFTSDMRGGWAVSWGPCSTIGDPNTTPSPQCQNDPNGTTPTTQFQLNW